MHSLLRLITGSIIRRGAWMIPRRWFWVAFVLAALTMLAAPHMAKAQDPGGSLSATSITGTTRFGSGLSGQLNAVLIETERRSYHNARVTISGATLGAAARAGMRGVSRFLPYVGLALTASEIMGWTRDADGKWFNLGDGVPSRDLSGATYVWCAAPGLIQGGTNATYCSDTQAGMAAWGMGKKIGPLDPGVGWVITDTYNSGTTVVFQAKQGSTVKGHISVSRQTTKPSDYKSTDYRPPTAVTDAQLLEAILNNPNSNTHRDLLHDVHGSPHMFPEVVAALNGIAASIGNATGTTPGVDGDPVDPDTTDPTDPDPAPPGEGSELPAFCEWAGVVCEFIEWYKAPGEPLDEVPLPEETEEFEMQQWESGQSGGSCPAPESVSVMGESVEFTYQPLCDWASLLYYAVIAMALAVAGKIIMGVGVAE